MRAMCACEDGGLLMFVFARRELFPSLRRNIKINRTRGAKRKPSNGAHIFHVDWRQRRDGGCQSSCLFQSSPSWWPQARRRARIFEYAQFMVILRRRETESDSIHDKCVWENILGISFEPENVAGPTCWRCTTSLARAYFGIFRRGRWEVTENREAKRWCGKGVSSVNLWLSESARNLIGRRLTFSKDLDSAHM